jgi:hypothetical protein
MRRHISTDIKRLVLQLATVRGYKYEKIREISGVSERTTKRMSSSRERFLDFARVTVDAGVGFLITNIDQMRKKYHKRPQLTKLIISMPYSFVRAREISPQMRVIASKKSCSLANKEGMVFGPSAPVYTPVRQSQSLSPSSHRSGTISQCMECQIQSKIASEL